MPLPEKTYDRLNSLCGRWEISQEDLYYSIENGLLRVCVWMPLRYLERGVIKNSKFIYEQHEHREGFIGVRSADFHRICSNRLRQAAYLPFYRERGPYSEYGIRAATASNISPAE